MRAILSTVAAGLTVGWLLGSCDRQAATSAADPVGKPGLAADTVTVAPELAAADSSRLLAPGRAGKLHVGMRVGQLKALFGMALREVTIRRDDADFPAFAIGRIKKTSMPAVLLEPLCEEGEDDAKGEPSDHCRIWRITVYDPGYRTAGGVGVGSRYGDLKLSAPITFVGPNPMGVAATAEDWRMNFLLDAAAVEARNLPVRSETVHDTVRITAIQLYR